MQHFLTINDESARGRVLNQVLLQLEKEVITVRQLIKLRMKEEERDNQTSLKAFRSNGFFIRINNRQISNLDEAITINNQTQVSFVEMHP